MIKKVKTIRLTSKFTNIYLPPNGASENNENKIFQKKRLVKGGN